jgi:hypothetical protein
VQTLGDGPSSVLEASGRGRPADGHAERAYATRFPAYEPGELIAYRFYRFPPRRMKLFDETSLGGGVSVLATVRNGQVAWERTEVYRPEVTTPA